MRSTSKAIIFLMLFLSIFSVEGRLLAAYSSRKSSDLPELTVESNRNKILHVLAYLRDYSSLSNDNDTIFLFREKLVDFMLVPNEKVNFKGWTMPRTLLCRSYYRFSNAQGLDSVSDECGLHFSWTDWVGLPPLEQLPTNLSFRKEGCETMMGKYSPCIIWDKKDDRVNVKVNVLAAEEGRKWCPAFKSFFKKGLDFDNFKLTFDYDNVLGSDLSAADLTRYAYYISSIGRGYEMQRIPTRKGTQYVSTEGEMYVLDREFLTKKEAKKWEDYRFDEEDVGIFEPADAPPLDPEILALIKRVEAVNKEEVRLSLPPDERLISIYYGKRKPNIGERALNLFKQLTGISLYKSNKNFRKDWRQFRKEQMERNKYRTE